MSDVTVDVLLPVRGPAPWLSETLESLVNQTWQGWRLVAVQDGACPDVEHSLGTLGSRVEVIFVEGSPGLVALLNQGLRSCRAPYVARIDADDVAWPKRFQLQASYLNEHPECVAVGTSARLIDENGALIGSRRGQTGSVLPRLRWRNAIMHPSAMMRREALDRVGGYRPEARHIEDYDLWLRLATIGDIANLEDLLLDYRIHKGQVTKTTFLDATARRAIRESRLELAAAEKRSLVAALLRHTVWTAVKASKGRFGNSS